MNLLHIVAAATLILFSQTGAAQSINLGSSADFVLFTTNGAVSNTGITHLTGNVGSNNGSSTAFGNVDGVMHDNDGTSAQCAADLLIAYNLLKASTPNFFPAPLLGNRDTLIAGNYKIAESASLTDTLFLDAKGNANAEFIFQIQGAFSTASLAQVVLLNGAKACNVFWKIEGKVSLAAGSTMRGNIIANNAEIVMYSGVTLEGRALSTTGAIIVADLTAYMPIGCGSPVLTGPVAPNLGSTSCYAFFSANGGVTNTGVSTVKGDVGTNVGLTVGFDALTLDGIVHTIPDVSTAYAAADLLVAYNYMNAMTADIKLLYPVQFGRNLTLTPHTYLMESACVFTDSLYLNAQGNANAVFVIKIVGALSTSTYAKVLLQNGAQAKNVYWLVEGAVDINGFSEFKGTVIANNGAINFKSSTKLEGRALATMGALSTAAITAATTSVCSQTALSAPKADIASIYTMPGSVVVTLKNASDVNSTQLNIYNVLGKMMVNKTLTQNKTTIATNFPSGIYFYKVMDKNKNVQSGKLISK